MKHMNKFIIAITTIFLLTLGGTVLAKDFAGERARKGQHHQRGMQEMPVVGQMRRALRHLDLSDEQKEGIRAVTQAMKKDVRPIMLQTKAGHLQLKALIKAGNYDEQAVAALAEKEGVLAAERLMIASRAMSEIFSQLTDEQRSELDTMAAQRKQRHAQGRGLQSGES